MKTFKTKEIQFLDPNPSQRKLVLENPSTFEYYYQKMPYIFEDFKL
jgi:hypothetical protein